MADKIRLLILEDHQVTLDGLRMGLSAEPDMEICGAASNSDDGLQLAATLSPDVILLDLHLPGASGPKTMVNNFANSPVRS